VDKSFIWDSMSPSPQATYPEPCGYRMSTCRSICSSYFVSLALGAGFTWPLVTKSAVRSYRTLSPLPEPGSGGILSVALAVWTYVPPVLPAHLTLWSPGLSSHIFTFWPTRDCSGHPFNQLIFTFSNIILLKVSTPSHKLIFLDAKNFRSVRLAACF